MPECDVKPAAPIIYIRYQQAGKLELRNFARRRNLRMIEKRAPSRVKAVPV